MLPNILLVQFVLGWALSKGFSTGLPLLLKLLNTEIELSSLWLQSNRKIYNFTQQWSIVTKMYLSKPWMFEKFGSSNAKINGIF